MLFLQPFRLNSLRCSDSWLLTGLQSPTTSLTISSSFLSLLFPVCDFNSLRSLLRNFIGMYYVFSRNLNGSWIGFCFTYCSGCLRKRNDKENSRAFMGKSGVVVSVLRGWIEISSCGKTATAGLREATDERSGTLAFGYPKHRRLHGTLPTKSPHPDQELSGDCP